MPPTVPQAVQSCHELLLWLIPQLTSFPVPGGLPWVIGWKAGCSACWSCWSKQRTRAPRRRCCETRTCGWKSPSSLEAGRRVGIPIGNVTSQFFANLYLDDLDHYLKQVLHIRPNLRYVDDMVVLDHDKARLADIRAAVCQRLAANRLRLHPNKAHVTRTANGLNLLGYVVYPTRRRLRNDNGHRFARKLRRLTRSYGAGRVSWATVTASVHSWIGHAKHADTDRLRRAIFSQAVFTRGTGQRTASA
jgi:hypothetical protein